MHLPSDSPPADISTADAYRRRIVELEAQLAEARETLDAIRSGEVDALVVGHADDRRVFTLESADRPYRLLVEEMREGAVTLSTDGLVLYCNQAFADLVATPASHVVGSRFERFVAAAPASLGELFAQGGRREIVVRNSVGGLSPARLSVSTLATDDATLLCGVVTDLSEARDLADARQELAVEAARREGEESYRGLFNSIDAGFCIVELAFDADGRARDYKIVEANPAFERQTGLVDAHGKWISELVPDLERHWYEIYGRVALTGESTRFENRAESLEDRWYDVYAYRVGRAEARHVAILFNDITDRRRAEALLRDLNDTLERRVAERTAELATANDRLQIEMAERARTEEALRQSQKLEAIGQLTGGVAHDFNNLLTIIRSSVDLLRRREVTEEKRRRYIDAISDTADRAAKLTGQLLAYARKQPLRPEAFDIAARVRDTADMLRTTVGSRVQIRTEIECSACFVEADANQFETALLNMAVNARDAMQGEGTLTITVDDQAVASVGDGGDAQAPGDFVAVTVADTGQGIPADRLERIFEPFYTTKGIGKGTGLGLSQVYGFAKQSGGEIRVASEVDRGTAFTLFLPQVEARAVGDPTIQTEAASGPVHGRILLVEDNDQVGDVAAQLLEELGYTITRADDAASALALVRSDPAGFDLVFSDVVMPGEMSGVDLANVLKASYPTLPVVLTTGYSETLADGGVEGVALLRKPYSVEALSHMVRSILSQSAA